MGRLTQLFKKIKNSPRRDFINLANFFTILRIILLPVIVMFWEKGDNYSAFLFFIIAVLTDFFDGFSARLTKIVSEFGKLFDPFADKFFFVWLVMKIGLLYLPLNWIIFAILIEFSLMAIAILNYFSPTKRKIGSNIFGKMKMTCQCLMLGLLILNPQTYQSLAKNILILAICLAIASFITHIFAKEKVKEKQEEKQEEKK